MLFLLTFKRYIRIFKILATYTGASLILLFILQPILLPNATVPTALIWWQHTSAGDSRESSPGREAVNRATFDVLASGHRRLTGNDRGIQSRRGLILAIFPEFGMRPGSSSQYITEERQLRTDSWRQVPRHSSSKSELSARAT